MNHELQPVVRGALVGALLMATIIGFNHMDTKLSVYGGWFEDYAWTHSNFSMDSDAKFTFGALVTVGALVGAITGRALSRR